MWLSRFSDPDDVVSFTANLFQSRARKVEIAQPDDEPRNAFEQAVAAEATHHLAEQLLEWTAKGIVPLFNHGLTPIQNSVSLAHCEECGQLCVVDLRTGQDATSCPACDTELTEDAFSNVGDIDSALNAQPTPPSQGTTGSQGDHRSNSTGRLDPDTLNLYDGYEEDVNALLDLLQQHCDPRRTPAGLLQNYACPELGQGKVWNTSHFREQSTELPPEEMASELRQLAQATLRPGAVLDEDTTQLLMGG